MTAGRVGDVVGLRFARANLLLGPGGEAAALYRLAPVSYPYVSVGEKWALQRRLERLVSTAQADCSLWRVTRAVSPQRYVERLTAQGGGPERAVWGAFVESHGRAACWGGAHSPEVYLAVSLGPQPSRGLARSLLAAADHARARLARQLGSGGTAAIAGRELEALAEVEQRLLERLAGVVALRRATTRELEWLLRRAALRGLGEPLLERYWQPDALVIDTDIRGEVMYEPLGWDLWRLVAAPLREDPHRPPALEVETEHGTSHQAMLCLGALADEPLFPGAGAELLHAPLEAVGAAVDAVLHARWVGNREALGQVRRRIVDAEQVYRDQLESRHGPAWRADDDRTLAREYEQVLQSGGRPPMLYATVSLAVGADSSEELERRVEALQAAYGDVQLHRPRGLQERLFFDHLPRVDGGRVREYVQQVTAQQFGAMVPTAATVVGDAGGVYLGYSTGGASRPVLYDVTAPPRESRASAVLLAGTLGSGKTMAAQLIAYGAALRGSVVVDFDPKPDHGWTNLPALDGGVRVLELTGSEEQRGALDPLAIGLDELREELACSYLLELLRDPPASWEHAITRGVRDTVRDGGRGCLQVIGRLRALDAPAGAQVADALEVIADVGLARLGFGDGTGEAVW